MLESVCARDCRDTSALHHSMWRWFRLAKRARHWVPLLKVCEPPPGCHWATCSCMVMLSHVARTSAGAVTEGLPASSRRALGFCWAAVLATLPEGATVEGVEALSPISFHISSAACVRLAHLCELSEARRNHEGLTFIIVLITRLSCCMSLFLGEEYFPAPNCMPTESVRR